MNDLPSSALSSSNDFVSSPFALDNEAGYRAWRETKLALRTATDPQRCIRVPAVSRFSPALVDELDRQIKAYNHVVIESESSDDDRGPNGLLELSQCFDLQHPVVADHADGEAVARLTAVAAQDARARYIPYTPSALNWHTDGYYHRAENTVRAFVLHCVQPALRGGANCLLDPESVYMQLRDLSVDHIDALMDDSVLTIPENIRDGQRLRESQTGALFSIDALGFGLHMRYSARPRNIVWKSDPRSQRALRALEEVIQDSDCAVTLTLQPGQTLVCNNVLHTRTAYTDGGESKRLLYRARFRNRIRFRPQRAA
ncbi:MAG: TauD/TfdA family dioxygenase [Pseudomonadota bacterium]